MRGTQPTSAFAYACFTDTAVRSAFELAIRYLRDTVRYIYKSLSKMSPSVFPSGLQETEAVGLATADVAATGLSVVYQPEHSTEPVLE
jgi:hypothetical protein